MTHREEPDSRYGSADDIWHCGICQWQGSGERVRLIVPVAKGFGSGFCPNCGSPKGTRIVSDTSPDQG